MATTRKRGRPRRDAAAISQNGIVERVRTDLNSIIGVCETCHRPLHSVAPIAAEIGVGQVVLAGFIKGSKGLSLETFDKVNNWVEDYKANPRDLNMAPATEAQETATA